MLLLPPARLHSFAPLHDGFGRFAGCIAHGRHVRAKLDTRKNRHFDAVLF